MTRRITSLAALLCLFTSLAFAAQSTTPKPVSQTETTTVKATVEAIDYSAREVTLKGEKGHEFTIHVPEQVTRFSSIKVGDVLTVKYMEGVVLSIAAPGSKPATGEPALTKRPGDKPGATIARQLSADVKVKAIDAKVPSVDVETEDGRLLSLKAENPDRLKNLKVGDVIRITYTESIAITVDAPK